LGIVTQLAIFSAPLSQNLSVSASQHPEAVMSPQGFGPHMPSVQTWSAAQLPQLPPHPSVPQVLSTQAGTQAQRPSWHCSFAPTQFPQLPPQPSSPQALPVQSGVHGCADAAPE